jgi:hypothetical protein
VKDSLIDYNDIFFEKITIQMEIESLNDDALLDECNHILAAHYENADLEDIFVKYFKTGTISKEDRVKAEAVYLLAYGDIVWEV